MEHKLELSEKSIDDFIEKLTDALNDSAETAAQTFQEFVESLRSMIEQGKGFDFWGTTDQIVEAIMGGESGNRLTKEEVGIALSENMDPVKDNVSAIGNTAQEIEEDTEAVVVNTEDFVASAEETSGTVNNIASDSDHLVSTGETIAENTSAIVGAVESVSENTKNTGTYIPIADATFLSGISSAVRDGNAQLTELLMKIRNSSFDMASTLNGKIAPMLEYAIRKDYSVNVNINYDNMLNVQGSVNTDTLPKLQTLLRQSCDYTKKEIYSELNQRGLFRKY